MNYSISQIATAIDGEIIGCACNTVYRISIDSRDIKKNDCFFAIKGKNFDGHKFVDQAFASGCICAVVSKLDNIKIPDGKTLIVVENTVIALGKLAKFHRDNLSCKVIAITGSVGKTTTRDMLEYIVREKFKSHCAIKSFNNDIGLPLTILGADESTELLITEIGSNHTGEISYLSKIVSANIGVITKVAPAHLEGFGAIENIVKEKCSIIDGVRPFAALIVNAQKEITQYLDKKSVPYITFKKEKNQTRLNIDGELVNFSLPGSGYLENAQAIWCICKTLGINKDYFIERISSFKGSNMRMEIIDTASITIINDCYNANPCSMENAIDYISSLDKKRRKVFIAGTMGELGEKTQLLHQELGEKIGETDIALLLTVGPYGITVGESAKKRNSTIEIKSFDSTEKLCDKLDNFLKKDDIVLVKASRSIGLEKTIDRISDLTL